MIHLGMFTMPFHHPARDYTTILDEDQEAILLADRLGFTEVFVGEHFSSWSERITSPLIFLATLINRTERIKFGTGVINDGSSSVRQERKSSVQRAMSGRMNRRRLDGDDGGDLER